MLVSFNPETVQRWWWCCSCYPSEDPRKSSWYNMIYSGLLYGIITGMEAGCNNVLLERGQTRKNNYIVLNHIMAYTALKERIPYQETHHTYVNQRRVVTRRTQSNTAVLESINQVKLFRLGALQFLNILCRNCSIQWFVATPVVL